MVESSPSPTPSPSAGSQAGAGIAGVSLSDRLDWQRRGTEFCTAAASQLADADLAAPSGLPGWTRAHVLAHLARNGDALRNLLHWARTGIETPMYPVPERRDPEIEETASLPPAELRAELDASIERLDTDVAGMTARDWDALVRTRQGREITAAEVPWMRCREVWVHAVDLAAGADFEQIPVEVGVALLVDACGFAATKPAAPGVRIRATDADLVQVLGDGGENVEAPVAELLPWVLGRQPRPDWPALPAWL